MGKEKSWSDIMIDNIFTYLPELPGIIMILIGWLLLYWSKKGDEWMYESGGPDVFTNITWIRNTFGEKTAKRYNVLISWGVIVVGVLFVLIGILMRF
ncbi:MAG: hypothetical protein LBI73_14520 [Myroides sp.]|jgi:hypothetical protein|nr:hypothetical protein [Myroides sp.]